MMAKRRSKVEEHCSEMTVTTMEESSKLCSDCRASNTPLWRTGPDGPKSLCNACGIRYSKKRRMEFKRASESKPAAIGCSSKAKSSVELEKLKRRQREKQEKILEALLRRRRDSDLRWQKLPLAASFGGSEDGEEAAEAARLLLCLSAGVSIQS